MMKKHLLIVAFLFLSCFGFAQTADWVKMMGGSGQETGKDIAVDSSGNIYLAGEFKDSIRLGNGIGLTSPGSYYGYLAKFDQSGNCLWAKRLGGQYIGEIGIKVDVDHAGNIYVGGSFTGTAIIDTVTMNSFGGYDAYMAKFNSSGSCLWARNAGGTGNEYCRGMTADSAGNSWLTGEFNSAILYTGPDSLVKNGLSNHYLVKWDANGIYQWNRQFNTPDASIGDAVAANAKGQCIWVGHYTDTLYVNGDTLTGNTSTSTGGFHTYMILLDPSGNVIWVKGDIGSGGTSHSYPFSADIDEKGGVYVAGHFDGPFSVDGQVINSMSPWSGTDDLYYLHFTAAGSLVWMKVAQMNSSSGYKPEIKRDQYAGLYITGNFIPPGVFDGDSINWAGGTGNHSFAMKCDTTGSRLWLKGLSCNGQVALHGFGLAPDANTMYITGYLWGDMGGPGLLIEDTVSHYAMNDAWMAAILLPNDSVWPGDANSDFVANNMDLLSVGLSFGNSGPVRPAASLNWQAQACPQWADTTLGGVNMKHADTNGDGIVNFADTSAISLNYGMTHSKMQSGSGNGPLLSFAFDRDSAAVGDTVNIIISLGQDTAPAANVYGLALTFNYDKTLIDSASIVVNYDSSWLGTKNTDMLTLDKDFPVMGKTDMALVRNDHTNRNGSGEVARISVVMVDDLAGKTFLTDTLAPFFTSVVVIDSVGNQSIPATATDSLIVYEETTGIEEETGITEFALYPNPATDHVEMAFAEGGTKEVTVTDLSGKVVMRMEAPDRKVNFSVATLNAGIYFVKVTKGAKVSVKKLLVY